VDYGSLLSILKQLVCDQVCWFVHSLTDHGPIGARQAAAAPHVFSELRTTAVGVPACALHREALLHVMNSVYTAADTKKVIAQVGLDIAVALDTIEHDVLAGRL